MSNITSPHINTSPSSLLASHQTIANMIQSNSGGYIHVLVVIICMMTNMIDGFDITAMAVVANSVGSEMGISEKQLGFVFSFSLAGMMFGAMFLASLSDTFGRRNVIIISLSAVGISVLCTAYTSNLVELVTLRFISGLGAGAMLASQATLTSEYSSNKYKALSVAIVVAGYPLGAMMTGLVGQYMIVDYGWRSLFILGGSISLLMCFFVYLLLPESLLFLCNKRPKNALERINNITAKYKAALFTAFSEEAVYEHDTSKNISNNEPNNQLDSKPNDNKKNSNLLQRVYQLFEGKLRKRTLLLWSSFMLAMSTMYFIMSWLPKLIINTGFSSATANYAFSAFNFGGVAGIFIMGIVAIRWKLSLVVSLFLSSAGVLMFIFAFVAKTEIAILIIIALIGVALQGGFTGLYALSAKLYPTKIRTTGVGWSLGVGRLGAVFGPLIAGFTIAAGVSMQWNFNLFAIPVLISGIAIYRLTTD